MRDHRHRRAEYFTSRKDAFLSSLRLNVREESTGISQQSSSYGYKVGLEDIHMAMGYRELHKALWAVHVSSRCDHPKTPRPVKLSTEVATTNPLQWRNEGEDPRQDPDQVPERVCVLSGRDGWRSVRQP